MTRIEPFTEAGLPAGPGAEVFFSGLARFLLDTAEEVGWDQPAALWAVASPAATAAAEDPELRAAVERSLLGVDRPGSFVVGYGVREVGVLEGHPRSALPGVLAPSDVAAVVLVAEGWRGSDPVSSPGAKLRPFRDPDRVETRSVFVVDRSGACHDYARDRGSDQVVSLGAGPVGSGGRVGMLLGRVLGVAVPERIPLGFLLGRALLGFLDAQLRHAGVVGESASRAALPYTSLLLASMLDGLDRAWVPRLEVPSLGAALVTDGPRFQAVRGSLLAIQDGASDADPAVLAGVFAEARAVAANGWDGFWKAPGVSRWCYLDESGGVLTPQLWDWYGSGLRVELLDDLVPDLAQSCMALSGLVGVGGLRELLQALERTGWGVNWPGLPV